MGKSSSAGTQAEAPRRSIRFTFTATVAIPAACLILLGSVPPGSGLVTLADIPPLLGDAKVRKRQTAGVRDQVLRDFWTWYEELSPASRAHMTGPLMNKLRAFLLRRFARAADRKSTRLNSSH